MLQLPCFFQNRGRQIIKRLKKAHNAMDYNNVSINKKPKFDLTSEEIKVSLSSIIKKSKTSNFSQNVKVFCLFD